MRFMKHLLMLTLCLIFETASADDYPPQTAEQAVQAVTNATSDVLSNLGSNSLQARQHLKSETVAKVSYLFDFNRMTALAVGFPWRQATLEQKKALVSAFRGQLIDAYYRALMQVKDIKVVTDQKVEVVDSGRELIVHAKAYSHDLNKSTVIDYSFYKSSRGYRIYNVRAGGISLVLAYRQKFNQIVQQNGIDGLINYLREDQGNVTLSVSGIRNSAANQPSRSQNRSFTDQQVREINYIGCCFCQYLVDFDLWLYRFVHYQIRN